MWNRVVLKFIELNRLRQKLGFENGMCSRVDATKYSSGSVVFALLKFFYFCCTIGKREKEIDSDAM